MTNSTASAEPVGRCDPDYGQAFFGRHRGRLVELLEKEIKDRGRLLRKATKSLDGVTVEFRRRGPHFEPTKLQAAEFRFVGIRLGVVEDREISIAVEYARFDPPMPFCHLRGELVIRAPESSEPVAKCELCRLNYFGSKRELLITSRCAFCGNVTEPCVHDALMRLFPIRRWSWS